MPMRKRGASGKVKSKAVKHKGEIPDEKSKTPGNGPHVLRQFLNPEQYQVRLSPKKFPECIPTIETPEKRDLMAPIMGGNNIQGQGQVPPAGSFIS
ncbi:hypothetical protein TNIN_326291 [Trichonephila inaurata madagascariensis]|uniref:Uncharacterized protein n=1 Tax=Trichonephila inaurata madagascariensis TaxID=2747483 RepID=A0A8X7BNP1_9ARAC|nr:hypothetical protein TNIN_326291 [Trichonephila inaurata madagascariensis]